MQMGCVLPVSATTSLPLPPLGGTGVCGSDQSCRRHLPQDFARDLPRWQFIPGAQAVEEVHGQTNPHGPWCVERPIADVPTPAPGLPTTAAGVGGAPAPTVRGVEENAEVDTAHNSQLLRFKKVVGRTEA